MKIFKFIFAFFVIFQVFNISAQIRNNEPLFLHEKNQNQQQWVDSVFNSLTFEEKIAQFFVIRTFSNKNQRFNDSISQIIKKYNIGGLTFFQGSPARQAQLTNHWQSIAKTPLLITIDAEWGLGMRLDSAFSFPKLMTLGAMQNNDLVYKMGVQIGEQCRRIGVQMNFAPVVDINSNPKNPVIGYRSFGENPGNVSRKGVAFVEGMQSTGVFATAKHFPGHGDTDNDSHYTLPVLNHSIEQIQNFDLEPFRKVIDAGVGGIMVAHLFIPAIDNRQSFATSLSDKAVAGIMKQQLNYQGLAVTDALDMQGVTNYHASGDIELMALLAGNDILLLPLNIPKAISNIKAAVADGRISENEIETRVRKILALKYQSGLNEWSNVEINNVTNDINKSEYKSTVREIFTEAVTVVKNENNLLPISNLSSKKVALLSVGTSKNGYFQKTLSGLGCKNVFRLDSQPSENEALEMVKKLSGYEVVIVSFHNMSSSPSKKFGLSANALMMLKKIAAGKTRVVVDLFGSPYSLANLEMATDVDAIVVSYEENEFSEKVSAEIIAGLLISKGKLPVTASSTFTEGMGIETKISGKLQLVSPEELGIDPEKLKKIDSLAQSGIVQKAYPGCQVLLAKDGKVFYHKSFGYHTYDKYTPVTNTDLYDLASLTKILATTPSVMLLNEQNKIDINLPLSTYLPYLKNSNKQTTGIRDIMAHQAQFQAWIPFYKKTITDFKPDSVIYSTTQKPGFSSRVTGNLFIADFYRDTIFDTIVSSELTKKKEYKYSDLGFILLGDAIERITSEKLNMWVEEQFYKPLGLTTLGYRPWERFPLHKIAPTENDTVFRKCVVHGDVHDPGAAMLGGVAGHAGLFGNSWDVAVMMQMFLQNGFYDGKQFLLPETIRAFTQKQFTQTNNRRGLGFDRPVPVYDAKAPTCKSASQSSFGHSGFTGTYAWADPENGLVYVFLSNRVYPDAANSKLVDMRLRVKIHQVAYDLFNNR